MPRPKKPNQARIVAYLPGPIADAIRSEATQRHKTIGDLVAEAFCARTIVIRHAQQEKK